jgi:hypothetical protein
MAISDRDGHQPEDQILDTVTIIGPGDGQMLVETDGKQIRRYKILPDGEWRDSQEHGYSMLPIEGFADEVGIND